MNRFTKIILLAFLICLLIFIRMFEDTLFYDPLISFFEEEQTTSLPQFNSLQLLGNIALRFLMNTILSLIILWVVFKDFGIIKFSALVYFVFFIFLFTAYSYFLFYSENNNFLPLFYVRLFLIQPLKMK